MRAIDRETLRQGQEQNRDFALVEVLAPDKYREFHLPGAINVPSARISRRGSRTRSLIAPRLSWSTATT